MNTQKFKNINSFNLNVRNIQFVQKIAVRRVDYHFFSLLEIYVHVVVRRPIQELSNIYVHLAGLTFINKFWKRCIINKFMNHAVGVEIINQNDKRERAYG